MQSWELMIDDIRDSKNLKIYLEQLDEIKARLEYIARYINEDKDRFFNRVSRITSQKDYRISRLLSSCYP